MRQGFDSALPSPARSPLGSGPLRLRAGMLLCVAAILWLIISHRQRPSTADGARAVISKLTFMMNELCVLGVSLFFFTDFTTAVFPLLLVLVLLFCIFHPYLFVV